MLKQTLNGITYDDQGIYVHQHAVDFGATGNLAAASGSSFVFENKYGQSTIGFYLDIPSGSTCVSQISFDGVNWENASVRHMLDDSFESILDHGGNFIGSIAGSRYWRVLVTASGSTAGSVVGRADSEVSIMEGQEFLAPPHKIGYPVTHHDKSLTAAATGETIWTPASGKKIVLTQLMIVAGGAVDGTLEIFQNGGGEGNRFFYAPIDVSNQKNFSLVIPYQPAVPFDAIDVPLKMTTDAALVVSVIAVGYEI